MTESQSWGTITVEGRGTAPITWSDGRFDGDPDLVSRAVALGTVHQQVGLTPVGPYYDAAAAGDDPIAAIAVMRAVTAGGGDVQWDPPEGRSDEADKLLRAALYDGRSDDELHGVVF